MSATTKRTRNPSSTTVRRPRGLTDLQGVARSQDEVAELAVEGLRLEVRGREEAAVWKAAANDPSFKTEMNGIAHDLRDGEVWPA
jgi:hypothetical protein